MRGLQREDDGEGGREEAGGAGSDSVGQDKDLSAQGEVTPLLCQGRRSHRACGMGWPGQWNILGEWQGQLLAGKGGVEHLGVSFLPLPSSHTHHPDTLMMGDRALVGWRRGGSRTWYLLASLWFMREVGVCGWGIPSTARYGWGSQGRAGLLLS